jgi:AcrR family transcriptional regulator
MARETTEVRQEQIKKAVLHIIAEKGLHSLSTRNLALEVGISEGAIFKHFASKRDIILGIMHDVQIDLMLELRTITLSASTAEEKMLRFLCKHVRYLIENNGITILLFSEAAHLNDKALKQNLNNIISEQKSLIAKIITDGIAEGTFDKTLPIDDLASIYMGIPITLSIELVLNPGKIVIDDFCKRMFGIIMKVLKI